MKNHSLLDKLDHIFGHLCKVNHGSAHVNLAKQHIDELQLEERKMKDQEGKCRLKAPRDCPQVKFDKSTGTLRCGRPEGWCYYEDKLEELDKKPTLDFLPKYDFSKYANDLAEWIHKRDEETIIKALITKSPAALLKIHKAIYRALNKLNPNDLYQRCPYCGSFSIFNASKDYTTDRYLCGECNTQWKIIEKRN